MAVIAARVVRVVGDFTKRAAADNLAVYDAHISIGHDGVDDAIVH